MSRRDTRVRLNLTITPDVRNRIARILRLDTEAECASDVVKHALAMYEDLITAYACGARIIIKGSEGESTLWLPGIRQQPVIKKAGT